MPKRPRRHRLPHTRVYLANVCVIKLKALYGLFLGNFATSMLPWCPTAASLAFPVSDRPSLNQTHEPRPAHTHTLNLLAKASGMFGTNTQPHSESLMTECCAVAAATGAADCRWEKRDEKKKKRWTKKDVLCAATGLSVVENKIPPAREVFCICTGKKFCLWNEKQNASVEYLEDVVCESFALFCLETEIKMKYLILWNTPVG